MLALILDNDSLVRLIAFLLAVSLVGCWEVLAPRRSLTISKLLRWVNNWLISILNSVLLALVFPVLAVGVAILAAENHWGLFNILVVVFLGPPPVAVLLAEIILNVTAMFNHGNIYLPPGIDAVLRRFLVTPDMHRVHHSVIPEETNTNFGFNFPWWDRLFNTYRAQPGAGHADMEIGIHGFQSAEAQYTHRLLLHPFVNQVSRD